MEEFIAFIQHTHWDWCWWHTEEESRIALLDVMMKILEALEKGYAKYFLLDGQCSIVETYLELRPEDRDRVAKLVREGKLFVGPWYTQPDLYIVSGESIVRNLLIGYKVCRELNVPCMDVAYIPDSFGLPPHLPAILSRFNLRALVFSRGLSPQHLRTLGNEFLWCSIDGSCILAIFIPTGYLNAGMLGVDWKTICRLRRYLTLPLQLWSYASEIHLNEPAPNLDRALTTLRQIVDVSRMFSRSGIHVVMNGVDRKSIQLKILPVLNELERILGLRIEVLSLPKLVEVIASKCRNLEKYVGELRGSSYMNILCSYLSSRPSIKQVLFLVERLLYAYLEPLASTFGKLLPIDVWREIEKLWKELLKLHSHDIVCGTITDEPFVISLGRAYSLLKSVATLVNDIMTRIASHAKHRPSLVVMNPLPYHLVVPVEIAVYPFSRDVAEQYLVNGKPLEPIHQEIALPRFCTVLKLEPLSISVIPLTKSSSVDTKPIMEVRGTTIVGKKCIYRIAFDYEHKMFSIYRGDEHLFDLRIVDEVDVGDLYNSDVLEDTTTSASSTVDRMEIYEGDSVSWLRVWMRLPTPHGIENDVCIQLITYSEVPRIDVKIRFLNRVCNHRVSLVVDFPDRVRIVAYTPFLAIERNYEVLDFEEEIVDSHPFQEWLAIQGRDRGVIVATRGLYEYRLKRLATRSRIYVTLLRSVEWLAQYVSTRRVLAGPRFRTPKACELGEHFFELCLVPYQGDFEGVLPIVKSFVYPPIAALVDGPRNEALDRYVTSLISIEPSWLELYALKRCEWDENSLVIRLVNPLPKECMAKIVFRGLRGSEVCYANLKEEIAECRPFTEIVEIPMRSGAIETLVVKNAYVDTRLFKEFNNRSSSSMSSVDT